MPLCLYVFGYICQNCGKLKNIGVVLFSGNMGTNFSANKFFRPWRKREGSVYSLTKLSKQLSPLPLRSVGFQSRAGWRLPNSQPCCFCDRATSNRYSWKSIIFRPNSFSLDCIFTLWLPEIRSGKCSFKRKPLESILPLFCVFFGCWEK